MPQKYSEKKRYAPVKLRDFYRQKYGEGKSITNYDFSSLGVAC